MTWEVGFTSRAAKQVRRLAKREHDLLMQLVGDLELQGAVVSDWPNYSKLQDNQYHCHLNYRWVACWKAEENRLRIIKIYYVGSRENAPY